MVIGRVITKEALQRETLGNEGAKLIAARLPGATDKHVQGCLEHLDERVDLVGGSGGHMIQDEGTNLVARANLNFVGAGVTVTDDPVNNQTDVTIPGGGSGGSMLSLERTTNQPTSLNVWTPVQWDSEVLDELGAYNAAASNTNITIPVTGTYLVYMLGIFAINSTGIRAIRMMWNGTDIMSSTSTEAAVEGSGKCVVSGPMRFSAGQVVTVEVFQSAVVNLSFGRPTTAYPFPAVRLARL